MALTLPPGSDHMLDPEPDSWALVMPLSIAAFPEEGGNSDYTLVFERPSRPSWRVADRWLSLAETIEFLPEE